MGQCCSGEAETHGCYAVPQGSCKGRAAQVVSILGLILAAIFLIINIVWGMWFWALVFMHIGLPGIGYGIWIQIITLILAIIAFSMGLCCCTGERGWNCTSVFLLVLSLLYVLSIALIAISHGRLDEMIDKECEDDDDPYSSNDEDCDDSGIHGVFGVLYACIFINLVFSAASAYLLRSAAPEWVGQGDGDAPPVVTASAADVELANTKA